MVRVIEKLNKLRKRFGFYSLITLAILLSGVVLVVDKVGLRQETRTEAGGGAQWRLYSRAEFSNLSGWEAKARGGQVRTSNGWTRLLSSGKRYPVLARWNNFGGSTDSFIPTSGDFKIKIRLRFRNPRGVAGYGVSGWGSSWCDGGFKYFFGLTWHKNKKLKLRLFNNSRWINFDTRVHVLEVIKVGNHWVIKLDGAIKLRGNNPYPANCRYPDSLRFGDPTTQSRAGVWPRMLIDYVRVFKRITTASPSPSPGAGELTFAVIGDTHAGVDPTRTGSDFYVNARDAANYNHKKAVEKILEINPSFYIHLGDMVDKPNGSYYRFPDRVISTFPWDEFFQIESPLINNVKIYPTIGNHEFYRETKSFYWRFRNFGHLSGLLKRDQPWYSFDYGNAHFVNLWVDYDIGEDGTITGSQRCEQGRPQYQWLENDLMSTDKSWKIVFFHVSIFNSKTFDRPVTAEIRENLHDLFKKHGVDVVINAHRHFYERVESEGITYITSGGGSNVRVIPQISIAGSKALIQKNHVVKVTINDNELTGEAIKTRAKGCNNLDFGNCVWWSRPGGAILDSFTITK